MIAATEARSRRRAHRERPVAPLEPTRRDSPTVKAVTAAIPVRRFGGTPVPVWHSNPGVALQSLWDCGGCGTLIAVWYSR